MKKLWDKGSDLNSKVESFTIGNDRESDIKLAPWDICGSLAHVSMLDKSGLITAEELEKFKLALQTLLNKTENGSLQIEEGVEDIHSQIEIALTSELGETGKKVHTGRSRNDQVLCDLRLFYRYELLLISQKIDTLVTSLLSRSDNLKDVLMPGYTHMQVAMPTSAASWFAAWAESLCDDTNHLLSVRKLINKNPLGSAAGFGTNLPIDRECTTAFLEFDDMNVISSYAQTSRGKYDFALAGALASIALSMTRMSTDIILYLGQNHAFFSLKDELTTGSSIMPQKKNPDVIEIVRAKCNSILSVPSETAAIQANLNSGYHRDMQLLKEAIFPALENIKDCLDMMDIVVQSLQVNHDITSSDTYKHLFATAKVNSLVKEGMAFREAYRKVATEIDRAEFSKTDIEEYTHTGSIGNLSSGIIRKRMKTLLPGFDTPGPAELFERILNY